MYRVSFTFVYGRYVNESSFVDFLLVLETGFKCLDVKNNMINYNVEVMCTKILQCLFIAFMRYWKLCRLEARVCVMSYKIL